MALSPDAAAAVAAEMVDISAQLQRLRSRCGLLVRDPFEVEDLWRVLRLHKGDARVASLLSRCGANASAGEAAAAVSGPQRSPSTVTDAATKVQGRPTRASPTMPASAESYCERRIAVAPFSTQSERWSFDLAHQSGASVREVRQRAAKEMHVMFGKVQLLGRRCASEGLQTLEDDDDAANASHVIILNAPRPSVVPREVIVSALTDSSARLRAAGSSLDTKKDIWGQCKERALAKVSLKNSHRGMMAFAEGCDHWAGDAELAKLGDAINDLLETRPQWYNLRCAPAA